MLVTRNVWGAFIGIFIGHLFDQGLRAGRGAAQVSPVAEVFFRITFEMMGHVAKADGRVSEAQIEAARQLMQELRLGPGEIARAVACFRAGKAPGYDVDGSVERLRKACGQRHDLLRNFMELQLRAALIGEGMSPQARIILTRVADRLGMSGLEFARMEASLQAQRQARSEANAQRQAGRAGAAGAYRTLAACYAELEVESNISDREVTRAYRRLMSRHHPDKLIANGLPESMTQMAKEKTQRIQEAYEGIRAARGMH
jgi:DnaJ like chaperone protein